MRGRRINIPNLWRQYGPVNNIGEFTLDKVIDSCRYDKATITGDAGDRYMAVLLYHTISGTYFRKLIFSNSLLKCRTEAEKWLDSGTHKPYKSYLEAPTYYALVYDIEGDDVILWDRVDSDLI